MSYSKSIQAFAGLAQSDPLVDSYRLLIGIELALKEGGCAPAGASHNVPQMLNFTATLPRLVAFPFLIGQLSNLEASLKTALNALWCNGKAGLVQKVPDTSYPYMRYVRRPGDWGGQSESQLEDIRALEVACHQLKDFLTSNSAVIGLPL